MLAMKQPRISSKVVIILSQYRIIGNIHLHPGQRLSDYMNGVKDFVPITDVKVTGLDNENEVTHMNLLEVNVRHILLIYPVEGKGLPSEYEESAASSTSEPFPEESDDLKSLYVDPFKKKS